MFWLRYLYRKIRNLDRLDAAVARQAQTGLELVAALCQLDAAHGQLRACRRQLETTQRDRDVIHGQLDDALSDLGQMVRHRRRERRRQRLWITHAVQPVVRVN